MKICVGTVTCIPIHPSLSLVRGDTPRIAKRCWIPVTLIRYCSFSLMDRHKTLNFFLTGALALTIAGSVYTYTSASTDNYGQQTGTPHPSTTSRPQSESRNDTEHTAGNIDMDVDDNTFTSALEHTSEETSDIVDDDSDSRDERNEVSHEPQTNTTSVSDDD
jgi:hypothetical protein